MRPSVALTVIVATLLLFSPLLPKLTTAQPSQGNWIVTGTQVVRNESITLNGNLTVESGGNLTLIGSTLSVDSQRLGQYYIDVMPGGSMYVTDSEITSSVAAYGYGFVASGSNFVMKRSQLHGAGWCNLNSSGVQDCNAEASDYPAIQQHGGLIIATSGATIEGNQFSGDAIGLIVEGSNEVVTANTFAGNPSHNLILINSNADVITNNTFTGSPTAGDFEIVFNTSNGNDFYNNTMTSTPATGASSGIDLSYAQGNVISDNVLSGADIVDLENSENNTIAANSIRAWADYALNSAESPYTSVINNSIVLESNEIYGPSCGGGDCATGGIRLESSPNSTVAGNSITGGSGSDGGTLYMVHSSGSLIENNQVLTLTAAPGIYLYGTQNDTIEGNVIANCWHGLFLYSQSDSNVIADNAVFANETNQLATPDDGPSGSIVVLNSSANSIYSNDFYDFGGVPYDNGQNAWSSNGAGNYWSPAVTGSAVIEPRGVDSHPLSSPRTITKASVKPTTEPPPIPFTGNPTVIEVTGVTEMSGQSTVYPAGQLTVATGAKLIINNSRLTFGTPGNLGSGFPMAAQTGGAIIIDNSVITGSFAIAASSGASVLIENSTLSGLLGVGDQSGGSLTLVNCSIVGTSNPFTLGGGGVTVISGSTVVSKDSMGFQIIEPSGYDSTLNITDSKLVAGTPAYFLNQVEGTISMGQGNLFMANTTMTNDEIDIGFTGSQAVIENCSFIGGVGSSFSGASVIYEGNSVEGRGLTLDASTITFVDNRVTSAWGRDLQVFGNDVSFVRNNIRFERATQPLNLEASSPNAVVSNNTVYNRYPMDNANGLGIMGNNVIVSGNNESYSSVGLSISGNGDVVKGNSIDSSPMAVYVGGSSNVLYHNNFINCSNPADQMAGSTNAWSFDGEGNYWGAAYKGQDANLDGIGDAPYQGINGIQDNYPFMQPNGWITKFYLTLDTSLPPSTNFSINGSSFTFGKGGTAEARLGYVASYVISLPQSVRLPNGSSLIFVKWGDGSTAPTRMLQLSSNSTLSATYSLQAGATTTSATTPMSTTTSSSSQGGPGGIPEFPSQLPWAAVVTSLVAASYLLFRRRRTL